MQRKFTDINLGVLAPWRLNNHRAFVLLAACILCCSTLQAQNLVLNPGFENFNPSHTGPSSGQFILSKADNWYSATKGTTDFYKAGKDTVPMLMGNTLPHAGNGFSGFHAVYVKRHEEFAEYAGGSLSEPLKTGQRYSVALWIKRALKSDLAVTNIGIVVSAEKTNFPATEKVLELTPDAIIAAGPSAQWTLVKTTFVADGGEKFFCIGSFTSTLDSNLDKKQNPDRELSYAYYYIDDASIQPVTGNPDDPALPKKSARSQSMRFGQLAIYFNTDEWRLSGNAWTVLDSVATIMKSDTHIQLLIVARTDTFGNSSDNWFLSLKRGNTVEEYLIALGVPGRRIAVLPRGESTSSGLNSDKERCVEFQFYE